MYISSFSIKETEGLLFAKQSGDDNLIHLSDSVGYNSIYGEKIAHGVLVILKFLKTLNEKNFFNLKIQFRSGFKYNSKINIFRVKNKRKEKFYKLVVDNFVCANIEISNLQKNNLIDSLAKTTFKKKYSVSKSKVKKFNKNCVSEKLNVALKYLSKYVGKAYPGKNSLITEIEIFKKDINLSNNILISSLLKDKRLPIIDNRLTYKNYYIEFKTLIRPSLKVKLHKPSKKILKTIHSLKNNILILGGSSGIGYDMFKLFLNNQKVKIICTYYKNKVTQKKKNLIVKKIDIAKNINLVFNVIKKYSPLDIYYFPTPRIQNKPSNSLIKLYKKYYINLPIEIINFANKYKSNFFYPSTTFIEEKKLSPYAKVKQMAENKIKKLKKLKVKVNLIRIQQINTKQNLLLTKHNLPNFRSLIESSKKIHNIVFFKNK